MIRAAKCHWDIPCVFTIRPLPRIVYFPAQSPFMFSEMNSKKYIKLQNTPRWPTGRAAEGWPIDLRCCWSNQPMISPAVAVLLNDWPHHANVKLPPLAKVDKQRSSLSHCSSESGDILILIWFADRTLFTTWIYSPISKKKKSPKYIVQVLLKVLRQSVNVDVWRQPWRCDSDARCWGAMGQGSRWYLPSSFSSLTPGLWSPGTEPLNSQVISAGHINTRSGERT